MSHSSTEFMGTPAGLFHWIPGEMIVVVRLTRAPLDDALDIVVEQIRIQLNTFLARYHLSLDLYGTAGRWDDSPTMPPVRRRALCLWSPSPAAIGGGFFPYAPSRRTAG